MLRPLSHLEPIELSLQADNAEFLEYLVGRISPLPDALSQLSQHSLLFLDIISAFLETFEDMCAIILVFDLEVLEVGRESHVLCGPSQVSLEEVEHVVFGKAVSLHLLIGPLYLSDDIIWHVTSEKVLHRDDGVVTILVPTLLSLGFLFQFSFCLCHFDLFNHRRRFFFVFLPDILVSSVSFLECFVEDLLELAATLLGY